MKTPFGRFSAAHPICCQRSPHFAVASSASHKLEQSSFMFCQVQNFPYLLIISNTNYEDTKTLSSALPSQSLKLSEHHPACTEWLPFLQQAAFLSNWFIPTTDHTTNFATKIVSCSCPTSICARLLLAQRRTSPGRCSLPLITRKLHCNSQISRKNPQDPTRHWKHGTCRMAAPPPPT